MRKNTRRGPLGSNDTLAPLFTWRSAICESDLAPTTRHVALTLSLYMNERGGSAHPGAPRLADDTGLHVSTIRAELGKLLDGGWLALVQRGGLKGERRVANAYEARFPPQPLPLADDDGSEWTTGRPDRADPSSSPRTPLAQDDPISSLSLHEISPRGADAEAPPPDDHAAPIKPIIAQYVTWYREAHNADPFPSYIPMLSKQLSTSAARSCTSTELLNAVYVIATNGKRPSTLLDIVCDYRRDVKAGVA